MSMSLFGRHNTTTQDFAGPLLLGYFFNWALLGVLNVQVYLYHVTFSSDPILLQCLVYGILIFEWVQTALITQGAFYIYVYHFGNPEALAFVYNGWFALPAMCAIVSMVVQGFYAWRIYVLSKLHVIVGVIAMLSLLQGVGGIITGVKMKTFPSTAKDVFQDRSLSVCIYIWLIGSAITDVVIAVTMTVLMLRRKTGIWRTDKMVNKIIRLVVETGTLTAAIAVIGLSLIIAFPGVIYYEPALHALAKLYSNSFVTNLLNRAFLDSKRHPIAGEHVETLGEISLSLSPRNVRLAPRRGSIGDETSGDRSVEVYPVQKVFDLDKASK